MVSTDRCRRLASRGRAPNATQLAPFQEPSDAVPTSTGLTYLVVVPWWPPSFSFFKDSPHSRLLRY
jgi:hypothetical protein